MSLVDNMTVTGQVLHDSTSMRFLKHLNIEVENTVVIARGWG